MTAYLVLTSPGAPRNDEKARFVADRFSWPAFAFPAIWLLVKRQWIAGGILFVLQIAAGILTSDPRAMLAGILIELALRMLVALEGPAFLARRLEASGWTLQSVITADDLTTAEMIYDHETATAFRPTDADEWRPPAMPVAAAHSADGRAAVGLFANYGER